MLDFEGRGGWQIGRNGIGRKKSSNRSKKVVAKKLREAFWTDKSAILARGPGGGEKSILDGCIRRIQILSSKKDPKPLSRWAGGTKRIKKQPMFIGKTPV